jgi:apolipoprotein N-acyltransferase
MICYEGTVPAIARRFALDEHGRKQIDWLVNISNDGWFVRFKDGKVLPSAELPQHAATCAFRAVENRLPIVRSVNTGISCFIDSAGRIRNGFLAGTLPPDAMSRTGMPGWIVDRISIDKRTTIFSKYGQWLGHCCELCLILPIIIPLSVRCIRKIKYRTRSLGLPNGT